MITIDFLYFISEDNSIFCFKFEMRNINLRLGEMHLLRNPDRMGETTMCSPSVPQNNFGSG